MFWSLAPLVIGCILLAGLVGMCSFPAGRDEQGGDPVLRRGGGLARGRPDAGLSRSGCPQLPAGWQPNSGGRGGIENGRTVGGSAAERGHLDGGIHQPDRHVSEPDPEQRRRGQAGRLDPSVGVSDRNGRRRRHQLDHLSRCRPERRGRRAGVDHQA